MVQCDWCGDDIKTNEPNSDPYVINLEHKYFCKIHTIGKEPFKDCLDEYSKHKEKNVQEKKRKKEERLRTQQKVSVQDKEKEKIVRAKHLKALEAYSEELKHKLSRQRYEA